jgi:hypothetical protein
MAITIDTLDATDTPNEGRASINSNFQNILSAFGGSTTAFPKRYVALLALDSGSSDPSATVLENTLGATVVWTHNSTGTYYGTSAISVFTANKTVVFAHVIYTNSSNQNFVFQCGSSDNTYVFIKTASDGSVALEDLIGGGKMQVEIIVYP